MKRAIGINPRLDKDATGAFLSVDWKCPYCQSENVGFYFVSSNLDALGSDFEIDHACDDCGRMVTIECSDVQALF